MLYWFVCMYVLSESTECTLELTEPEAAIPRDAMEEKRLEHTMPCLGFFLSLPCTPQSTTASQVSPLSYVL